MQMSEVFLIIWSVCATVFAVYYHHVAVNASAMNITLNGIMKLVCRGKVTIHETKNGVAATVIKKEDDLKQLILKVIQE